MKDEGRRVTEREEKRREEQSSGKTDRDVEERAHLEVVLDLLAQCRLEASDA